MHKKGLKFALVVELAKLNFVYITVLKQPKVGLGLMKFHKIMEIFKKIFENPFNKN
jgi:hypothetical protein